MRNVLLLVKHSLTNLIDHLTWLQKQGKSIGLRDSTEIRADQSRCREQS
jgi:hypothetical protein